MSHSPFLGRTIQVVKDLSLDEQAYLYKKTRDLKQAILAGKDWQQFCINKKDRGVYLLFLEDSTRTKESFRNAAIFHSLKVNDFDARTSSFQKKENITDTVKMLMGYSSSSMFVIRSKQEGVCRWLDSSMSRYAQKAGLEKPSFINAGDGQHEHPTQEFLDEFSFLEYYNWDASHIHIALVGDLFHGRTVHSKVEGLKIFKNVEVDLIAPAEIAMPVHYVTLMKKSGYKVRIFDSIEEYIAQKHRADVWYFTRLQLERMGERLVKQAEQLRQAVSFSYDYLNKIDAKTRFFHPLPRHSETPTIPMFLDDTPFNAWDEQSRNGYFTRIVAIGMLGGSIGGDFEGESPRQILHEEPHIETVPVRTKSKPEYKIGIRPVEAGIVIDHIGVGSQPRQIWDHIAKIRHILDLHMVSSQGVFKSEHHDHYKGIVSIPGLHELNEDKIRMLAAIAPGSTLNTIVAHHVVKKFRLSIPDRVSKLPGLRCKNEACISNPEFFEPVVAEFIKTDQDTYRCIYCNTPHAYRDIWIN